MGILILCALLLSGKTSADNRIPIERGPSFSVKNMTEIYKSCDLGNFMADAFLYSADADIAVISASTIKQALPMTEITEENIKEAIDPNAEFVIAELPMAELKELLAKLVSCIKLDTATEKIDRENSDFSSFIQVSGVYVKYDVSAPETEKIMELLIKGNAYDDNHTIRLLTEKRMLPDETVFEKADSDPVQMVENYLLSHAWENTDLSENRIKVIGCNESSIAAVFPKWVVIAIPLLVAVMIAAACRKIKVQREFHGVELDKFD